MKYPEMRFLDVHPGNFVWEPNLKRWFFIDLGLIPYIGSDYYYKWDSFEKYYQHVWETRLWQKKHTGKILRLCFSEHIIKYKK